ncbi:MAG: zinc ribbon domain-containing protein [Deltaproteobacteria bacterium]|nr:zinc ribbon domain-containing protein [Deltaproteobacteria bacterium]
MKATSAVQINLVAAASIRDNGCHYSQANVRSTAILKPMILIAGIAPKTKRIDQNPMRCPSCGLHQAYRTRIDHYLNLFFIPVLRIKKGEPFVACERCAKTIHELGPEYSRHAGSETDACKYCGKSLDHDFKYCPSCGKSR